VGAVVAAEQRPRRVDDVRERVDLRGAPQQVGASDIGSSTPDSSSSGRQTPCTKGANASSSLSISPIAYDAAEVPSASSTMITTEAAIPETDARRPKGSATTTRTTPCTPMVTMLPRVRPRISETRRAGVTRCRSITPSRSSWMIPKPAKPAPKMASCSSRPGTNTRHASSPRRPPTPTALSSGPNSTR